LNKTSLTKKLEGAIVKLRAAVQDIYGGLEMFATDNMTAAINKFSAFVNEVNAQTGKAIDPSTGLTLRTIALSLVAQVRFAMET